MVTAENTKKHKKVVITPNIKIFFMFEKKLPLCMLKPDAKTIGGRHTKKNVSSLNVRRLVTSCMLLS